MIGRIGVWLMRSLAWMPLPWLRGLGAFLGRLLFVLAAPRRKVALCNLAMCFPELTEAQRVDLARRNFIVFARPGWTAAGCGRRRARWWPSA